MSFLLPHLDNGWEVDQAILTEPEKLVVIRWGHDWNPSCMIMDQIIMKVAYKLSNFVTFYVVDITKVPDFNTMYELYDQMTLMFFYRNKHIMIDTGTGNNNKINWVLKEPQDLIDICEVIYRGARKGKGLVVAPKDYSLRNSLPTTKAVTIQAIHSPILRLEELYTLNMKSQEKSSSTLTVPSNPTNNNEFVFSFTCDPEDILDLFERVAADLSFDMIEREGSYATAVKKIEKKKSMMSLVNCFAWFQSDRFTAVKVLLSRQSRKGAIQDNYIAEVKGLVGLEADIQHFICTYERLVSSSAKIMLAEGQLPEMDPTQKENPYYLEACSHHIINKLILNSEYQISDNIAKMLSDFSNNFRNIEESVGLLPLPMKNVVSMITSINQQLEQLLVSLKYPLELLPFSRITVENYIFNKLESQLYSIYRLKNIQTQQLFHQKRTKILQTYSIKEILDEVCLSKKFWSVNADKLEEVLPMKEAKKEIYFNCVSKQFEKIVFTNNPRQKIKYCQMAYTELKSHFYDFSKRKYQLASMEDIIPVLIVVVLFLEVAGLRSEFDIMLDFINYDPNQMEAQKRLLINLSESYNYINRDWALK